MGDLQARVPFVLDMAGDEGDGRYGSCTSFISLVISLELATTRFALDFASDCFNLGILLSS